MSARIIPDGVIKAQLDAADPDGSRWVAANAGSGKTHVLALRVIRLLLRGVDPAKILCVTFTKAAAANMAMRVFDELARWTSYDDDTLDAAIRLTGETPSPALRATARRLFAIALETPGGLKVQTIHAFCTRLLHQFPFEADVAARFGVLDDTTEHEMVEELVLDTMLQGAANLDSALGRAFTVTIASAADQTLRDILRDAIAERDTIENWIAAAGSLDHAIEQLSTALSLKSGDTIEKVHDELLSAAHILETEWPALIAAFAGGSSNDRKQVQRLEAVRKTDGSDRFDAYVRIFCTDKLTPRDSVMTGSLAKKHPDFAARLLREQDRICRLLEKKHAVECRDRTRALMTIAHTVARLYRAEKNRRGLLDYDDLIDRTLTLFQKTSAAWVLYKLDLGINHILIDEAQDTSPKQWDIIRTLVSEFTAGLGAREVRRTLFVVGDDKQSIFSFQGAAPDNFGEMQRELQRTFDAAEMDWKSVKLQTSFRSGEVVLGAVDKVFEREEIFASVTSDRAGIPPHIALPDAAPGEVEIWDLTRPDKKEPVKGWDAPFDETSETSPTIRLARKIARNVALLREKGARPGDVLILVRQRGSLFEAIIRALKNVPIPVAGADRLVLTEHIAVMDLIALADSLLLPQDDLALANVLKSPLFGLSEGELYEIAWNRGPLTLREALLGKAAGNPRVAAAAAQIETLTDAAQRESPFTFYANLLSHGGRNRILERLGHEVADALDEFLNLALTYESRETPSLQGFVAWLRAAEAEVKRDMEIARDEVRVMTVHGAKGLEAPIVILADTTTPPAGYYPPRLMEFPLGAARGLVWAASKIKDTPVLAGIRETALKAIANEYRRLLYVAMTRAQLKLIVCGTASRVRKDDTPSIPEGCWYELVKQGLVDSGLAVEMPADDGDGQIWRFVKSPAPLVRAVSKPAAPTPAPAWLHQAAAKDPPRATIITPSSDDEFVSTGISVFDRPKALARGRLIHRLMQSLPDIPQEHRKNASLRFLERAKLDDFSGDEIREMSAQALALLGDARFSPLFAPGSRAEVPIVGKLAVRNGPPPLVSGQIDRLAVTNGAVYIADYKTNRPAPRTLDEVLKQHGGYVRQLALYRAILSKIYPDRPVRAGLVWTDLPDLMEIPASLMDREIADLTSR